MLTENSRNLLQIFIDIFAYNMEFGLKQQEIIFFQKLFERIKQRLFGVR